ncbi:MAG: ABC transporter permease [Mariprofundaceae bacterium]|nr:ABC transporter permease [Mariprofundaceae bacterium]
MMQWLESIGIRVEHICLQTGVYPMLLLQVIRRLYTPPWFFAHIISQCEKVGVQSLPVVLLTAIFTGMVLALQSWVGFHRFGAESMVATVVSLSMVRELGPVLVGLMVAGRVGASFAAELGTMRVSEQIDALWTLSTDPIRYLIIPRIIAATLMMPLLVILADAIGIFGGYLVSVLMLEQNSQVYIERATLFLKLQDLYSGLLKAVVFGGIIGLVSCAEGFYCKGGAQGVGQATTRAVVISAMSILISDYFLTIWIFQ